MDILNALKSLAQQPQGYGSIEQLFFITQHAENQLSTCFLSEILTHRVTREKQSSSQPLCQFNIDAILSAADYSHPLHSHHDNWPLEYDLFEQLALQHFAHWAEFWCQYEIYKLKNRYQGDQVTQQSLPIDEAQYQSSLIDDVAKDNQLYLTLHHDRLMSLSDAILLINLSTFVLEHRWFEMLNYIQLSQTGEHFILTTTSTDNINTLVSTARIQRWQDRDNWLFFTPFFQSSHWTLCLPSDFHSRIHATDLSMTTTFTHSTCTQSFEAELNASIRDKSKICEVLRLTVSGSLSQRTFFIFLAQKRIMSILQSSGFSLAYTVIEQPWMIHFYETLDYNGYIHCSYKDLNDTGRLTYKGLWVISDLKREFDPLSYREYKRRTIKNKNRRKLKNGETIDG